ncbi:MAG: helix-turn-helix transcriptional regulator [Pseudolabrys sp.]
MNSNIVDNTIALKLSSPFEVKERLRIRVKARRLAANLTQDGLAKRANVSLGTLKHFERTGDASMEFVVAIAFALGAEREFEELFRPSSYKTTDDVIEQKTRRRGRRK